MEKGRGLLLHTCCAWCLLDVLETFRRDYPRLAVAFYNPNIHPRMEFERRLKSVRLLCERLGLELHADGEYGLAGFLSGLYNSGVDPVGQGSGRCSYCYRLRMRRTAETAGKLGMEAIGTTLLSSPHQRADEIVREGESAAAAFGVAFDGRRLTALHGAGKDSCPSGLKLYRQRYCGCVFSESEAHRSA